MVPPLILAALVAVGSALAATPGSVRLGSEVLADHGFRELRHKRVALITNATGVDRGGRSTIDALRGAAGVRLVALMAPEHGLRGELTAGQEFPDSTDARTGLPVFSLYGPGPTRKPTRRMLTGVDAVIYDVQDVGVRSYTYISTLGLAMDACGEAGVEFVVLDRPNPLGGQRVEGPMVVEGFRTFVSRWDIPYVYGMTPGELSRMINGQGWTSHRCGLTVVPMQGWRRSMTWADTGLPWVATSPNVPNAETAACLVATGMLGEIGGVSVGLGTPWPFRSVAAPWIDGAKLARQLGSYRLKGVTFEPTHYTPTRGAFKDQAVQGVRLHFGNSDQAALVPLNFYCLEAVKKVSGHDLFGEALAQGKSFAMFDKVNGTDATRRSLQAGTPAAQIVAGWQPGLDAFRRRRGPYLLY